MPTMAELLRTNPRGFGPSMPALPEGNAYGDPVGEIRNQDDPYYGTGGPSLPALAAYYLSGIPMAQEGLQGAREGALAGDPMRALGGLGQAGIAALPYSGSLAKAAFETAPRMATVLGSAGLSQMAASGALSPDAAMAEDAPAVKQLYEQRAVLERRRSDAEAEAKRQERTGRGPRYDEAKRSFDAVTSELSALDRMISDENKKNSPEYALEIQAKKDAMAEAAKKAELDKPFAERHPWIATGLALGAPVASGALAYKGMGKIAGKGESLMADLLKAREAGDVTAMAEKAAALKSWNRWAPLKQFGAVTVPATLPLETRGLGDIVDRFALPDSSKAQDRAEERLSDPVTYLRESIPAIASGLSMGALGGKMAPSAPRSDAKGMLSLYGGKDAPTLAKILREGGKESESVQAPLLKFQNSLQKRESAAAAAASPRIQGPETPRAIEASPTRTETGQSAGLPTNPDSPTTSAGTSVAARPRGVKPASNAPSLSKQLSGRRSKMVWDENVSRWRHPGGEFGPGKGPAND